MTVRRSPRLLPFALLGLILIVGTGCGSRGKVSGNVTYQGKPVVWGTVSVIASDNIQYPGEITPEGTYSIPNVPRGPVTFCVTSPNPQPIMQIGFPEAQGGEGDQTPSVPDQPPPPPGSWFPIPEKYGDPRQSGLTGVVRSATVIDLHLQ